MKVELGSTNVMKLYNERRVLVRNQGQRRGLCRNRSSQAN